MPAYAFENSRTKPRAALWELDFTQKNQFTVSLERFDLMPGFEIFHPHFFDPSYRFFPSVLIWDYGVNLPKFTGRPEENGALLFGENNSRVLWGSQQVLETRRISGALNLFLFVHSAAKHTLSFSRQLQEMNQLLVESNLRSAIRKMLRRQDFQLLSEIEENLCFLKAEAQKNAIEWGAPLSFLSKLTIGLEDLMKEQYIRIYQAPFFEIELKLALSA